MRKPNFFIIGAPKCGTTSLASWLSKHEHFFLCNPKEPNYFNFDQPIHTRPSSLKAYEGLFSKATKQHKVICDASTGYLRSNEAVSAILKYSPSSKFLICLRNPIEMAPSCHSQLVKVGIENETQFELAWALQSMRRENSPPFLQYGQTCLLGKQIKRLFHLVSRKQVLVVFLEKIKANPAKEYYRILKFLEISENVQINFTGKNFRAMPNSLFMTQLINYIAKIKHRLGFHSNTGIGGMLHNWNNHHIEVEPLSRDMEIVLCKYFGEDIRLLEKLLKCNLSHWLKNSPSDTKVNNFD